MSDNHLKTPLGSSLQAIGKGKAADAIQLRGKSLPCTVAEVLGSGYVKVNFEVRGPFTLPQVVVAIEYPEYIRYPIQVGDKGMVIPADVRLGGITGLGSGTPDLTPPGNLSALSFVWLGNKAWAPPVDAQALELYAPNGVIIHDTAHTVTISIKPEGITIQAGGHPVTVKNGDVIADDVSLKTHIHTGVTVGAAVSGMPVP